MNNQLEELYSTKWRKISEMLQSFNEEDLGDYENMATHPLLIKTDKEYENADLRVMIFGQETNQWIGPFEEGIDINSVINMYDNFYLKKGYEQYGKPFWNFIRSLKSTSDKKKVGYIWNNVLKIGKSESGTPQQGLINYTIDYFNVIPQEIEILKPNVLLFLSGHQYDKYIMKTVDTFNPLPIEGVNINELCILKFDNLNIDIAIRTYHPGYLQRLKERGIIINKIINDMIFGQ